MSENAIHPYGARCVCEALGMDKSFHTLDLSFFLRTTVRAPGAAHLQMDADYYIKNK
jgi:hypothetical protein